MTKSKRNRKGQLWLNIEVYDGFGNIGGLKRVKYENHNKELGRFLKQKLGGIKW